MQEITRDDYKQFLKSHKEVEIGGVKIPLHEKWRIKRFAPTTFTPEFSTVWSFPERGDWATHAGDYRGNWSPYIPRNLILRYTKQGEIVLDQMVGSGTTLVECKLLGRKGIGVDINPDAIMVTRNRLDFTYTPLDEDYHEPEIRTFVGDARNLNKIEDESIDFIATHPPYAGIISYSKTNLHDLSRLRSIAEFINEMHKVAKECMRVLKPQRYCAILIGDTRKHKHFVPITTRVLMSFLDAGFILKEDIIKLQWKMKSNKKWFSRKHDFYLIAHEHLYVFRKPDINERTAKFRESMKWW